MKIFFYSTPHFQPIRDQFVASIKDDWELRELKLADFESQNEVGGGMDSSFAKVFLISCAFRETEPGETFIISDTDIVFYSRCTEIIEGLMKDNQMCISRERKEGGFNIGFMVMKNEDATKSFWMDVHSRMEKRGLSLNEGGSKEIAQIVDQTLVNALIYSNHYPQLKVSFLPDCFWNWSRGDLNKDIVLHHANCTLGIESKIIQFEYVKKFMNNK